MAQPMVLLGAAHPVAGYLFLEVIPDSEVGYVDIYQLTDSLYVGDYRSSIIGTGGGAYLHMTAGRGMNG